jgi:thiamine-monophosphate kinase
MADVSDGLLLDAGRIARASGLAVAVDLDAVPLSPAAVALAGADRAPRLAAATAGDDYELLFAAPEAATETLRALAGRLRLALTPIGRVATGEGVTVHDTGGAVPLPERLGYEHRAGESAGMR